MLHVRVPGPGQQEHRQLMIGVDQRSAKSID